MPFHSCCEGYLLVSKSRRWRLTAAHRYYCVLDQQHLRYYTHHNDAKPRGDIDLRQYTAVETPPGSPSRCFFSSNNSNAKTAQALSFQLMAGHPDLPDFTFRAQSTQSKEDWLGAIRTNMQQLTSRSSSSSSNNNNTVLEKWLERFELSTETIVAPSPVPSTITTTSSSSSSSSSAASSSSPGNPNNNNVPSPPSAFCLNFIPRQKPFSSSIIVRDDTPSS